jgi:hypothetical protein
MTPSKKVAIVQSNYIPWKGYFDLVAAVDEFIFYDEAQFTKNDWRNRNKIKTPNGTEWLSVPVGQDISRRIRDVEITDARWQDKHWRTLSANYARAAHFDDVADFLRPLYLEHRHAGLSKANQVFIESICRRLRIRTALTNCWDYELVEGKTERLVALCVQAGANCYVSGPAAKGYLDESQFTSSGISVEWFDYGGYAEYPQLWGTFVHEVSIVDLLFNCGPAAGNYMKFGAVHAN